MEEKKNQETLQESENTEETKATKETMPDRSILLWILAGIYLVYTGVRLCQGVLEGQDGGGIGFFIAGVVFVLIGAGMAVWGGYNALKNDNLKKAAKAAEERVQAFQELDAGKEEKTSMSLSERANLASRLSEEETDSEEK